MTRSVVEHDCVVGSFAHLAPGSVLGGNVRVGETLMLELEASLSNRSRSVLIPLSAWKRCFGEH